MIRLLKKGMISDKIGIHYIIYFVEMTKNEITAG
jgi:hypothetical protein